VEAAPYFQLLQIRLEQIDTGFARFRMPFRKELTQAYGMVHGGAIASLADTAVAFALLTIIQPGERVTTAEFKINFFAAVTDGEMIGEARVVHAGKRLVSADMEVKSQDGKLIAKGIATYAIIGDPKKKEE
jgi:acyl-CoA thioesterase